MIGDVFRDLEHYERSEECFADMDNSCPLVSACRLRLALADAADAFFAHLDGITLDALVCENQALFEIFQPKGCQDAVNRHMAENSA